MEKDLLIIEVEIDERNNFIIHFSSKTNCRINDIFSLLYSDKLRYFKVISTKAFANDPTYLHIEAVQCGYYNKLSRGNIDIRELFYEKVEVVTDENVLEKIRKESSYL